MGSVTSVETLLTVDEVLERLRISRTTLHALVRNRELAVVKIGRCTKFRATAVQAFIEGHEQLAERASAPGLKGGV